MRFNAASGPRQGRYESKNLILANPGFLEADNDALLCPLRSETLVKRPQSV